MKSASLWCNLLLFVLEILVLFSFLAVSKLKDNVEMETLEKLMIQKASLARNKRSSTKAKIEGESESLDRSNQPIWAQPRSSRTCRKIYGYWASACLPQSEHPDVSASLTKEKNFIRAILDHFSAYFRKLMGQPSLDQEQDSFSHDVPNRISSIEREAMPTSGADDLARNVGFSRVGESNLTSAEKCRRDGMADSLACMFEYEHPVIAMELYHYMRPLLLSQSDSLSNQQILREPLPEEPSIPLPLNEQREERKKRDTNSWFSISNYLRTMIEQSRRKRKRRELADDRDLQVCSTEFSDTNMISAVHVRTKKRVSLYVYRGRRIHLQLFEAGSCRSSAPVSNVVVSSSLRPVCKVARSKVFAYIMIKSSDMSSGHYNICRLINGTHYAVCRDWIFVPSHCKLYLV